MKQLLEDYQRRLKTINKEMDKLPGIDETIGDIRKTERLMTKASCYRTFIVELEKELNKINLFNSK